LSNAAADTPLKRLEIGEPVLTPADVQMMLVHERSL
jgi:hypothetical protein